ncbi:MAG TPA: dihydroorotate dehydrogenase electron transfer subunit, partial [Anaerolineae bacterium]
MMLPGYAAIKQVIPENSYTKTFVLDAAIPQASPGQFVMLWIPGLDEKPFAIVARDPLTLTVAAVGPFSRALHQMQPGDHVGWRGPFGRGFDLTGTGQALLIGGGYGVAALYFAAEELYKRQVPVTLAVGGRTEQDLLFQERAQSLGIRFEMATEDGSRGTRGFVTDAVREMMEQ